MKQATFLARRTWGQPNYLLLALAAAFLVALAPVAAFRAINADANRPDRWLPASTAAVQDQNWFRDQFDGHRQVLVSWDGCTLNNSEQVRRLAKQLAPDRPTTPEMRNRVRWFASAVAGPDLLAQMAAPPANLPADEAMARLEGVFIGPLMENERGDATRATCLAVELTPNAMRDERSLRASLDMIEEIAATECGVDRASIRMVGAPLDDLAIDDASHATLLRLAPLAAAISFVVCLWRTGSGSLALLTVGVGVIAAMIGLAAVFYMGVAEVAALGLSAPSIGVADVLTVSLFAPAYVMAIAAALRLIRGYQQAAAEGPSEGAVERAFAATWQPIVMTALTAAIAIAALGFCELTPLVKFSFTGAIALLIAAGTSLLITPVALHRFPPRTSLAAAEVGMSRTPRLGLWGRLAAFAIESPGLATALCVGVLLAAAMGTDRLRGASSVPPMLDDESVLRRDYAWFEQHIGAAMPGEVVVSIPVERERREGEAAEQDGQQYRLTPAEQARLVQTVHDRIAAIPAVSGVLSPAAFPDESVAAIGDEYRRAERGSMPSEQASRDLWRLSARMDANAAGDSSAAADRVSGEIRRAVEPVLLAYAQRDLIVQNLHERGRQLAGARVCILFRAPADAATPPEGAQEQFLGNLLADSGLAAGGVTYFNLAAFEQNGSAAAEARRAQAVAALAELDALVLASAGGDPAAAQLSDQRLNVVDATDVASVEESVAAPPIVSGGPRPISFVFSGPERIADAMSRTVAADGRRWVPIAFAGMSVLAMLALGSPVAGLAAMIPMLLPLVALGGMVGWIGAGVDVGVITVGAVALILGIDATLHFFARYRRAAVRGFNRQEAAAAAVEQSIPGTIDVALVGCIGLAVLAASGLASLELLGFAAIPLAAAAIIAASVALPALAAGPLAWYFGAPALPRAVEPAAIPAHPRSASAATPPQPHVLPLPADMRQDAAESPHSALHAKLQRLRRSAGE